MISMDSKLIWVMVWAVVAFFAVHVLSTIVKLRHLDTTQTEPLQRRTMMEEQTVTEKPGFEVKDGKLFLVDEKGERYYWDVRRVTTNRNDSFGKGGIVLFVYLDVPLVQKGAADPDLLTLSRLEQEND